MPNSPKQAPIRLLTAVPICDGHDSAISTINLEFSRRGLEIIYLGYHRRAREIVRAAVQEDVRAIGISSYNGGHVEFFEVVAKLLKEEGAGHIGIFGGGGGTITPEDAEVMAGFGVDRIFFAGTKLEEMVGWVKAHYSEQPTREILTDASTDLALGRMITAAEFAGKVPKPPPRSRRPAIFGFTGPGGAGKTTLIDELLARWLATQPKGRLAILSHDPSIVGKGALLGDRAGMIHVHDDRIFVRSLATAGRAGGLAPMTERCLQILCQPDWGFDTIFVETVGIGQEAIPFGEGWVDAAVFVLNPDYGSRLQLQKIAMLDVADIVVLNKFDRPEAPAALAELEDRLSLRERPHQVFTTVASRHRDPGVDRLFETLNIQKEEGA
tara:strand:+ start:6256 stop:7401 length:1146 start_codon:yes stop_codon:yes gene_type:complete